jgi:hypothetical protein
MTNTLQKIGNALAIPLIIGGLLLSSLSLMPLSASANEGNKTSLSTPASPTVSITNGKALVRGAKVTSVSGSTINATVTWGSSTLNWTVNTDSATKYYNRLGNTGAFADIATGDSISFAGTISGNGLIVLATAVKDQTGTVSNATISGKVSTINTGGLSFVMSKGKDEHSQSPTITVQTNAGTTITLNGAGLSFASIQTGDKVKAVGLLNADGTLLTATSLVVTRPAPDTNNGNFNQFIKDWFKGDKGKGKGNDN